VAWGGGGWGGPGGGGFGGGPHGRPGQAAPGLPFAGVPPEMVPLVEKLLGKEPEHPEPDIAFSHRTPNDQKGFTLSRLLRPNTGALLVGILLVAVETISLQAGPLLSQRAIDRGIIRGDFGVVALMAAMYLVAIVVNSVATAARVSWTGRLGQRLMYELRIRVFSHIQRLSLDFFTDEKAGRIMTRMTSDIEALSELLQDGIINLIVQLFTLMIVIGVLFSMDVDLALIVVFAIVPVMTLMTFWFRNRSESAYEKVRERIADVMADLQESLSGIRIVAMYNRHRYNEVKHRNVVGDHRTANEGAAKVAAIYGPGTDAVGTLGTAVVLFLGGRMVFDGTLQLGELFAFVLYLNSFFAPIQQLVQLYNMYQSGQAAVGKIADLLDTEPSVEEAADAVELPAISGEITFDDVTFEYVPGQPVLRDLDLTIRAGETFSLVGTTGAGKSTIAKLVTRFYDPAHGRVLVDGVDLRTVTLASLRRQLGVVPQEPFLFAGSIRDNVAFARPDASDEEVLEACQAVGLDELIEPLPMGLDTPVYERGSSLSSGERQLLALARAFLAQPRVLILDEATSSLDLKSEAIIERALDRVLEGRTAIIIAHRLSTAMRADRIAVVNDGRIVELGPHEELVQIPGGVYAQMYATWSHHMNEPV
jgi:ATP-binding cassette, subfamily B, bacterial